MKINTRYLVAGVILALAAFQACGHPLVDPTIIAGLGMLMVGDTAPVHPYIMDTLADHGIGFKKGVDPQVAMQAIRESCARKNSLTLEQLQKYGGRHADIAKAFTQPGSATSGLAQYDLEQGARLLYPITTIFRNMIARVTGGTGIQSNWRALTGVNPTGLNIGLSEGHRGGFMSQTVVDKTAGFKTSGMDNYVTEQAYLAAITFEDLLALATTTLLQGVMEQEEKLDIGGNNSILLGTPATPTGTKSTTGGHLSDGTTYSVIVVALTYMGMVNSTPPAETAAGVLSGGAVQLPYVRTNADGSTDTVQGFCGIQSAASSAITLDGGGSVESINATVTAVNGAVGYAWYLGATAGTERLVKITGYPTAKLTNTNSTGQLAAALPSSDTSTFSLNYDGMLTQILASGSGAYVKDLGGAALTTSGSGSGGITEFDALIADRIANYRLVPTDIFMSPTDHAAASAIILNGNTNLAPFVMGDASANGLSAAVQLKTYNNKIGFGTPTLNVHAHPFLPAGTCIFYSRTNPYPLSNVPNLIRKLCRRDYWSVEWPVVSLQRTMGVYFDGVLQMYFPPAFGVITGIKS